MASRVPRALFLLAVGCLGSTVDAERVYGVNASDFADSVPSSLASLSSTMATYAAAAIADFDTASTPENDNGNLGSIYPEAYAFDGDTITGAGDAVGQRNCLVSKTMPTKPRSLSFCHKFNDEACCIPQMDDENNEFFAQMTDLGLSCNIRGDIRKDPLAKMYCLNCDPQQPQYIRVTQTINGAASLGTSYDGNSGNRNVLLVSREWAYTEFKTNPLLYGPDDRFKNCGLLVSSPCQGFKGTESEAIDNRDRYTCGDDLYVPPNDFKVMGSDGNVDIDGSLMSFMNAESLGTPLLDEMFYFGLVDSRVCSDAEVHASRFPNCLRTATQMQNVPIQGTTAPKDTFQDLVCDVDCQGITCTVEMLFNGTSAQKCCCRPWIDERAFNSAGKITPVAMLSTALMALAVVLLN